MKKLSKWKRKNKEIKKKKGKNQTWGNNKSRTTKTYTRTTTTSFLKARTREPCTTFKHVLWAPNIQVSLGNSLQKNNEYNVVTHYAYLQNKVFKYINIYTSMSEQINKYINKLINKCNTIRTKYKYVNINMK